MVKKTNHKSAFLALSEYAIAERMSFRLKFPQTFRIKYDDDIKDLVILFLNELRQAKTTDKGASLDLSETVELNGDAEKLIIDIVNDVIKNNIIGLDIWTSENPQQQIKELIDKINKMTENKKASQIKIKVDKNSIKEEIKEKKWQKISQLIGVVLVVGGQFMRLSNFAGAGLNAETNVVQVLGIILVMAPYLPILARIKLNLKGTDNGQNKIG